MTKKVSNGLVTRHPLRVTCGLLQQRRCRFGDFSEATVIDIDERSRYGLIPVGHDRVPGLRINLVLREAAGGLTGGQKSHGDCELLLPRHLLDRRFQLRAALVDDEGAKALVRVTLDELLDLVDQTGRLADVLVDECNDDGARTVRSHVAKRLSFRGSGHLVNVEGGHVIARLQSRAYRPRERGCGQHPGQQHGSCRSAPRVEFHTYLSPFEFVTLMDGFDGDGFPTFPRCLAGWRAFRSRIDEFGRRAREELRTALVAPTANRRVRPRPNRAGGWREAWQSRTN